jgi:N-acetylglucosamine kinase-like BadF-type ATPase
MIHIFFHFCICVAFSSFDGMSNSSPLLEATLSHCKVSKVSDLVPWLYSDMSWSRIAELAPILLKFANENDSISLNILQKHVDYLVLSIITVAKKLQLQQTNVKM